LSSLYIPASTFISISNFNYRLRSTIHTSTTVAMGRLMSKKDINRYRCNRSSSPAPSAASDDFRKSTGNAPADVDDEAPMYPLEGKFISATDREHILSLPEIEREEILADRAQQVLHRQQDLMLKKAMNENAAQSKQKRKADAAELDDGEKRSMRPKTDKRSALDDYKRAREQKGAERDRRDTARDRKDRRSPTPVSDRDADGESEVEWAEPTTSSRRREDPPAELQDFERCRIGRSTFAKVCFYPGFEEAIRGCYARISIGMNRETGQNMYRMTQIKGERDNIIMNLSRTNPSQASPKENHTRWRTPSASNSPPTSTPSSRKARPRSLGRSTPARTADSQKRSTHASSTLCVKRTSDHRL
jgi:hypothetical protein